MLHKVTTLFRFSPAATGGHIRTVWDILFNDQAGGIRHVIANTSSRFPDSHVYITTKKGLSMKSLIIAIFVIMLALMLTNTGCTKKVIKVTEPPIVPLTTAVREPEPASNDVKDSSAVLDSIAKATLVSIYFDFDKSDLKDAERMKLEKIGPFLMNNGKVSVLAEGHCDERGSSEYNIGLGELRARAVKNWLTAYGIAQTRIEITSFGKERPVKIGCTDKACHSANRRVEWKVIAR